MTVPISQEDVLTAVGRLIRAAADHDQWLWRLVGQLRQGRNIKQDYTSFAASGEFAERVEDAPLRTDYKELRHELIKELLAELQPGTDAAEQANRLIATTWPSFDIRDIVAHWDLQIVGETIVASSFSATEGIRPKAIDLATTYRGDLAGLDRMAAFILNAQPRSIPITLDQINRAAADLCEATNNLRSIVAVAAVSYIGLLAPAVSTEA